MNAAVMAALDVLLVLSLLGLAVSALAARDTRSSVILFMAFGLVLALAWARLQAPDVALAEAAIGAGLSGALLLAALRDKPPRAPSGNTVPAQRHAQPSLGLLLHWSISLLCVGAAGVLAWALAQAFELAPPETLARAVRDNLADSGVSNPVTAVLLNFRAYDTLLELAVLLTAVLGVLALGPARPGYLAPGPVFDGLARWLFPVLIVAAGYLLWVGAHAPGGAFQAGATLAAAGVVLRLAGRCTTNFPSERTLYLVIAAGVGMFLVVGLGLLVSGRAFLGYPPAQAGGLILLIESAATVAIGATLVLAFIGGRPEAPAVEATGPKSGKGANRTLTPPSRTCLAHTDARAVESGAHIEKENREC